MTATPYTEPRTTPPQDPPRRARSTTGRVLTVVGAVLVGALVLQGAVQLLSWVAASTTTGSERLAATDVVELVADGAVEVEATDATDLRVTRTATYAWLEPRYEVTVDGDRTVVRHECPLTFVALRCEADLVAQVPEGTHVVVRGVDGAVRVAGAVGDVELSAADGRVTVDGARGDVQVRGVDGSVRVQDVAGAVAIRMTDGQVEVRDAGGDVQVRGLDGAVLVQGVEGDVDARVTDGRLEVRGVRGALTANTVDGNVLVAAVRGDITVRAVDGGVTVHGTGEPVALSIRGDGRQRVEGPTDPDADVRVELSAVDGQVAYLGPEG